MEMIIILLIAVEVVIVCLLSFTPCQAEHLQVLIREGPELGRKLASPIIQYIRSVNNPEAAGQTPSEVVHEELPKMREAVGNLPHLGVFLPPATSDDHRERQV